jgi:hypothetical protein
VSAMDMNPLLAIFIITATIVAVIGIVMMLQ